MLDAVRGLIAWTPLGLPAFLFVITLVVFFHELGHFLVARFFGDTPFVQVAGHKADVPRKPDPTAALAMAAVLGVDPSHCAFVGDSNIDMQTAAAAGMRGVGVSWGFRGRAELEAYGAAAVIDEPAQLLAFIRP